MKCKVALAAAVKCLPSSTVALSQILLPSPKVWRMECPSPVWWVPTPSWTAPAPTPWGGTYTGNPVACAATLAVLEVFEEENILVRGLALGEKLAQRMAQWQERFPYVDNARHMGPMAAFELVEDKQSRKARPDLAAALTQKAKEKGLILLSCGMYGNSIRFLMPITIEDEVLAEGLDIVEAGLEELA